jgi:hypothetical protein
MPFKSESQRRYLWVKHPKIARRWADKYGTPKNLPDKKHITKAMKRRIAKKNEKRRS